MKQTDHGQDIKEIMMGGDTYWVTCRSWVNTIYKAFGTVTVTSVGGGIFVCSEHPGKFEDASGFVKFICSIPVVSWFCGIIAALSKPKTWNPDRPISIMVTNMFYNRMGKEIGRKEEKCFGLSSCVPKDLEEFGVCMINYPDLGGDSAVAVRTEGRVHIEELEPIMLTTVATDGPQIPI